MICAQNNPGKTKPLTRPAGHPSIDKPFQHVMKDFVELTFEENTVEQEHGTIAKKLE